MIKTNRLPSEYQEVGYLQKLEDNAYINTGFTPNQNTTIEAKIMIFPRYSQGNRYANGFIFGSRTSLSVNTFGLAADYNYDLTKLTCRDDYNTENITITSLADLTNRDILIRKDKNNFYVDGELIYTHNTATFTCPGNLYLFGCNNNGSYSWGYDMLFYYCRIYDNGVLVRNLIPCYRKSDNVIGMYDLVNSQFYTNAGTGTFLKGSNKQTPVKKIMTKVNNVMKEVQYIKTKVNNSMVKVYDILPSGYQRVEYIKSIKTTGDTATQYIDTGYLPNANTIWELKVKVDDYYTVGNDYSARCGRWGANNDRFSISSFDTASYQPGFNAYGGREGAIGNYYSDVNDIISDDYLFDITKFRLEATTLKVYIDNALFCQFANTPPFTSQNTLYLFGRNTTGSSNPNPDGQSSMRIYYHKIWENGVLVQNFIPCYRKSDNVIGMYDTVSGTFFTNAGTGTFLKGNNV